MLQSAVDTDVLFKGASYGFLRELVGVVTPDLGQVGVLGAAPFVIRSKLRRANLTSPPEKVAQMIEQFVREAAVLEPTREEIRFAAQLEFVAQRANLSLDEGESLLCAIVIGRALSWLVTGDKRAVSSFEQLLESNQEASQLAGKVICLEQLFLRLINDENGVSIRNAVCREVNVDRALAICFSCCSPEVGPESWLSGLRSYVADLRSRAPTLLGA